MTDLLSVLFLIGLSLVLHIVALILKNTVLIIVSGLGWALVATYLFNIAGSGDPDFGRWTVGLGYFATILSLSAFFTSWWIHRKQTIKLADDKTGQGFYTDNDPDYKEFEEMYKARANRKKMRGK